MMRFIKKMLGSTSVDELLSQGAGFVKKKDYKRAIAAFSEAIQLAPHNIAAYRWRMQAYVAIGAEKEADADYDKIQELGGSSPTEQKAATAEGEQTWAFGNEETADVDKETGDSTPKEQTTETEAPVGLAFARAIYFRTTDYETEADCDVAIRDFDRAPGWLQNDPVAMHNRGWAYFQRGDYPRAIENFTAAIHLCQGTSAYHPLRKRGEAYWVLGNYRAAIADFTQVLAIEPGDVYAYGSRSACYNQLGEYPGAIADSTESTRLVPDYPGTYGTRGFAYMRTGAYAEAIADYSEAIRLHVRFPQLGVPLLRAYYEGRAQAYRASGDLARALADEVKAQGLRE
jgi:tetratricopeptide (TPR) repeat protein